jgi:hypothetical protein
MGGSDDNASQTAAAAQHHNICAFQGCDHNFLLQVSVFSGQRNARPSVETVYGVKTHRSF